jgi:probable HAF family extracellular repeat protein
MLPSRTTILLLAALSLATTAKAIRYTVIDIGTLPGGISSSAADVNKQGQIVGVSSGFAFLYQAGIMRNLGIYGSLSGGGYSYASAINDAGTVVGGSNNYAVVFQSGQVLPIVQGSARAINNLGVIVGQYNYNTGQYGYHAFSTQGGALKDLGTLLPDGSGFSIAYGINDSNVIVGESDFRRDNDIRHAFKYENGRMTDLGVVEDNPDIYGAYTSSRASRINKHGQIVGWSNLSGDGGDGIRAFLYENGHMHDLGALPGDDNSWANDINTAGIVVGGSETYSQTVRAFVFIGGHMYMLQNLLIANTGGWILSEATAINDAGQIVANGRNAAGVTHALLLNPQ